jgi:hypothetical protein
MLRNIILALIPALILPFSLTAQEPSNPVDLVNPHIGGIAHVLMPTFPTVHRPYGMLRFYP